MQTVLRDLNTPDLTYLGLLAEVIADIRRLDRPGTSDAAFRSGCRSAIAERLPPPGPGSPDWPPARLAPWSTPADAAAMIARHLGGHPGPATPFLARLAGTGITIETGRAAHRALLDGDHPSPGTLGAAPGTRIYEREGRMTAGSLTVARTRLVLIPGRIPGVAWGQIQEGQPAGEALAAYGLRRTRRTAAASRAEAEVDASAVLVIGEQVIGYARERVGPEFCAHAARAGDRGP